MSGVDSKFAKDDKAKNIVQKKAGITNNLRLTSQRGVDKGTKVKIKIKVK